MKSEWKLQINHSSASGTTGDSTPFEHAFQQVSYPQHAFSVPGNVIIHINAVLLRLSMPTYIGEVTDNQSIFLYRPATQTFVLPLIRVG